MIERNKFFDEWIIICDGEDCGNIEHVDFYECGCEYQDIKKYIKRNDWTIIKDGRDWLHLCPTCSDKREE